MTRAMTPSVQRLEFDLGRRDFERLRRPPRGRQEASPHLGGGDQLRRAAGDLVRAGDELLVPAVLAHHAVGRVSDEEGKTYGRVCESGFDKWGFWGTRGETHSSCVAPQPTALEAEMSPSVQREFLA